MKKLIVLVIACTVAFTTFGCGGPKSAPSQKDTAGEAVSGREEARLLREQRQQQKKAQGGQPGAGTATQ